MSWVQGRTCSIQHGTSAPRPGQAPERAEHTRGMLTGKSFRAQESMCWPSGALPWATLSGFRRGACPPLDRWASGLRAWDSRPQCSCSGLPRSRQLTGLTRTDCAGWTTAWKSPACGSRIFQCVRANQGGLCVCVWCGCVQCVCVFVCVSGVCVCAWCGCVQCLCVFVGVQWCSCMQCV